MRPPIRNRLPIRGELRHSVAHSDRIAAPKRCLRHETTRTVEPQHTRPARVVSRGERGPLLNKVRPPRLANPIIEDDRVLPKLPREYRRLAQERHGKSVRTQSTGVTPPTPAPAPDLPTPPYLFDGPPPTAKAPPSNRSSNKQLAPYHRPISHRARTRLDTSPGPRRIRNSSHAARSPPTH